MKKKEAIAILFALGSAFCNFGTYAQPAQEEQKVVAVESLTDSLQEDFKRIEQKLQEKKDLLLADLLTAAQKKLIPQTYQDLFNKLQVAGASLTKGPFPDSFELKGTTAVYGEKVSLTMLYAITKEKTRGVSTSVWLPARKKLSEIIPSVKGIADIDISDARFLLSDFEYMDTALGRAIQPALNMVGVVPLQSLKVPGIDQLKKFLKSPTTPLIGHAVLKPNIADSFFDLVVPPLALAIPEVSLKDMVSFSGVPMPKQIMGALDKITFKDLDIGFNVTTPNPYFSLVGKVSLFGQNILGKLKTFKGPKGDMITSVIFNMPKGWDITQALPELKSIVSMPVIDPIFAFTTGNYFDELLGFDLTPGMHFKGVVDIGNMGKNPFYKAIGIALGSVAIFHGLLAPDIKDSQFDINFGKGRAIDISLADLINVDAMNIPSSFGSLLKKTSLTVPDIDMSFGGLRKSMELKGKVKLFGVNMDTDLRMLSIGEEWKNNMIISLPSNLSLSSVVPELKPLDVLDLSDIHFGFIEMPFDDDLRGINYQPGFNINGLIGFTGALSGLKKITKMDGLILNGALPKSISDFVLKVKIPKTTLTIGKITSSGLLLRASLKPTFGLETTLKIPVPKTPDPLEFLGAIDLKGDSGSIVAAMDGTWKNPFGIKGLTLHGVGLEGTVNFATMLPSGLGIRAAMDIGKQQIEFAAKGELGSTTTEMMLAGSLKNGLYFNDLIVLTGKMVSAATNIDFVKNVAKKIPKIGLKEINMSIAPLPVTIAGKSYPEGISADMKMKLFGATGIVTAQMGANGITGKGSLEKVSVGPFRLTSMDGTEGPSININITQKSGEQGPVGFVLDGKLALKIFGGISQAVTFSLNADGATFRIIHKLFNVFESDIEGVGSIDNIEDTQLKGSFKQDGLEQLTKQLRKASKAFIEKAEEDLKKAKQKVKEEFDGKIEKQREIVKKEQEKAQQAIKGAKQTTENAIQKEIASTKARIAKLKEDINQKKKKCKKAQWYRKADKCAKSGAQITALGVQLAAQETYLNSLLKPGKVVVPETIGAAGSAVKAIPVDADPRVASLIAAKETALAGIKVGKYSAQGIGELGKAVAKLGDQVANLREVSFEAILKDLTAGKLPSFSIDGTFFGKNARIKDMQLDLEDPFKAAFKIIEKVIDLI